MTNNLNFLNFRSINLIKKPFLNTLHKENRLNWAFKNLGNSDEHWGSIIWSDECRFSLFGNDGAMKRWIEGGRKFDGTNIRPTKKYGGGGVMVWACFSKKGVGNLVFVEGKIASDEYIFLISKNLQASVDKMGLKEYIFQQDNAPCHVSQKTMRYFEINNVKLLSWPAQSPDLNPIENIWSIMKHYLSKKKISSVESLKREIINIWENLSPDLLKKLIGSMSNRCKEVIKNNGGSINY